MFRYLNEFRRCTFLFAFLLGFLPGALNGQSIEVDPTDEIEAIYESEEAVVKINDALKFRVRPFMDGQLKDAVKKLRYGVPYIIEATFDTDPGEERISVMLDWGARGASKDELEMVRVTEGDKTFYRAVTMVILKNTEMDILDINEGED